MEIKGWNKIVMPVFRAGFKISGIKLFLRNKAAMRMNSSALKRIKVLTEWIWQYMAEFLNFAFLILSSLFPYWVVQCNDSDCTKVGWRIQRIQAQKLHGNEIDLKRIFPRYPNRNHDLQIE